MKTKICIICKKDCYYWSAKLKACKDCSLKHKALNTVLSPVKARTTISKVSDKRKKLDALYAISSTQFKNQHQDCMAQLPGCGHVTMHLHHLFSGASRSKYYLDQSTWITCCSWCHHLIHDVMGKEELVKLGLKRME